ncbi:MAG TPA: polyphenol oxidase family protein [Pseudobdellovibrionaceae bacterium]|nr:polyphenol oxidase family protein [Pseudobdellovibrionaceae bacterium]
MKFKETSLGFEAEFENFLLFFGKKDADLQNLSTEYSSFQWARVRQTHSDLVLPSSAPTDHELREADAHYSNVPGLALLISTADCIPALVADSKKRVAAAVHAGWRGVEQRILPKTIAKLSDEGSEARDLTVVLGPHIAFSSFEAGNDVRDRLLRSVAAPSSSELTRSLEAQKSLVNLGAIAHEQLKEFHVRHVADLRFDTKTDLRFHSHRRDREKAGRQLSFICRLK